MWFNIQKRGKQMKQETFGNYIKQLREQNMLTIEDVAEKMAEEGICINDIKNWEKGMTYPETSAISKLSSIYHVPSRELMYYKQKTIDMQMSHIHTKFIHKLEKWLGSIRMTSMILCAILIFIFYIVFILPLFATIKNQLGL